MKKGCLFDLDGTLVDSLLDLANAVNNVLTKHHLPVHETQLYNHYVGNGVKKLVERALGEYDNSLLNECLKDFYTYYDEHCLDYTDAYIGMKELIHDLKAEGYLLGVVTNKPHHLAIRIVETLFPDMFEVVLGQQDLYPTKPSPESTHLALMTMKLGKDECVFIGDSNVDIQTAINVDMDSIGVCWGFRTREELENSGATYIVTMPSEIKELLDENRC
ncbi:MAG: HAD-IA family hydrolase [Coprobacillus sp.]